MASSVSPTIQNRGSASSSWFNIEQGHDGQSSSGADVAAPTAFDLVAFMKIWTGLSGHRPRQVHEPVQVTRRGAQPTTTPTSFLSTQLKAKRLGYPLTVAPSVIHE
jgi:hypothetical protein